MMTAIELSALPVYTLANTLQSMFLPQSPVSPQDLQLLAHKLQQAAALLQSQASNMQHQAEQQLQLPINEHPPQPLDLPDLPVHDNRQEPGAAVGQLTAATQLANGSSDLHQQPAAHQPAFAPGQSKRNKRKLGTALLVHMLQLT